jgi:hypothetical protein
MLRFKTFCPTLACTTPDLLSQIAFWYPLPALSTSSLAMPPHGKRRAETGCCRRIAKSRLSPNARWLHLSSAENDLKFIIQAMLFALSMYCSAMMQILRILFALEATADVGDVDSDALDTAIDPYSLYSWLTLACYIPSGLQTASSLTSRQRRECSSAAHPSKGHSN